MASSNTSTDVWYQALNKSDLNPPGYVFGIVWPILYILMSISAYRTFSVTSKVFFYTTNF
ncbi:tryptophan-rich sensory protein [Gammaproteobacteria bacterium]|nr:tryptophan-rich sensory protein [Gammaproteobacteria bacterium]